MFPNRRSKSGGNKKPTVARGGGSSQPKKSVAAPIKNAATGGTAAGTKTRDCRFCSRPFAMDRIQIHEGICERSTKKRKSTKPFIDPMTKSEPKGGKQEKLPSIVHWREDHEALIATIRDAKDSNRRATLIENNEKNTKRNSTGGGKLQLPPPPPSAAVDLTNTVQCPHCGRRFSREAGERHIPQCKDYDYNKPKKGR